MAMMFDDNLSQTNSNREKTKQTTKEISLRKCDCFFVFPRIQPFLIEINEHFLMASGLIFFFFFF